MTDKPDESRKEVIAVDIESVRPGTPRNYPVVTFGHEMIREAQERVLEGELLGPEKLCPICGRNHGTGFAFEFGPTLGGVRDAYSRLLAALIARGRIPDPVDEAERQREKRRRYMENYSMGASRMAEVLGSLGRATTPSSGAILNILKEREGSIVNGHMRLDSLSMMYTAEYRPLAWRDAMQVLIDNPGGNQNDWKHEAIPSQTKPLPEMRAEPLLLDGTPRALGDLFKVATSPIARKKVKRK